MIKAFSLRFSAGEQQQLIKAKADSKSPALALPGNHPSRESGMRHHPERTVNYDTHCLLAATAAAAAAAAIYLCILFNIPSGAAHLSGDAR